MKYPLSISKSVLLLGRHALLSVDDLLPQLKEALTKWQNDSLVWSYGGVEIVLTYRHNVFVEADSLECVSCGLLATHFAIEKVAATKRWPESWALNLYGPPHGKQTYFTQDHIVPKSKGGASDLTNQQVMCWPCNLEKGDSQ